jgi:hypothetical protein
VAATGGSLTVPNAVAPYGAEKAIC